MIAKLLSVCAYLNAGHSAGNVKILSVPAPWLHQSDTVAAAHILCGVLAGGDVHGCYYVGSVSVKPTWNIIKINFNG